MPETASATTADPGSTGDDQWLLLGTEMPENTLQEPEQLEREQVRR